ncbi:MAG TPA: Hsp20/alpha crystallin family protein [Thermoanaerobaculia bacterium]|jgi:HSP20 family protein|nr:Hsp20/alpha crystallin family protein [Thermoanaerobaculia bacterium]
MTFITRSTNPLIQARFFEPFFGRFNFLEDETKSGVWAPPVDVAEEKDKIFVRVEVPGMNESDLKVSFEDGLLTVSGERQFERKDDRNYHRIERTYGSFSRSFSLPRTVDASSIAANYRDGILEIEIPKLEEAMPKQIQINVGTNAKSINA